MINLAFLAVRNGRNAGDMIPGENRSKGYFQNSTKYHNTTKDLRSVIALQ